MIALDHSEGDFYDDSRGFAAHHPSVRSFGRSQMMVRDVATVELFSMLHMQFYLTSPKGFLRWVLTRKLSLWPLKNPQLLLVCPPLSAQVSPGLHQEIPFLTLAVLLFIPATPLFAFHS